MLRHDMDISMLMVYTQQIEEFKFREMNRDGKRPRLDEPSQHKSEKRFYIQDSSLRKKDKVSNKNSQGGGYDFERPNVLLVGRNPWVGVLTVRMNTLDMVIGVI